MYIQSQFPSYPLQTQSISSNDLRLSNDATISKIKSVAKQAFIQVGIALALNLTVMAFFATPFSVLILTGTVITAFTASVIQTAIDLWSQTRSIDKVIQEFDDLKHTSQVSMLNIAGLAGPNIAIHEYGHATAAWALFQKAKPRVQVFPFLGGMTSYTISHGLTKVGSFIGKHHALLFIGAAGMLSSTLFAMFEFALSDLIKDKYPTISKLMNAHGILQISQEVLYGLTTFLASQTDLSHDFMKLWVVGGIHPLIPIGLMILLPLLEVWLIRSLTCREKSQKINEIALSTPLHASN